MSAQSKVVIPLSTNAAMSAWALLAAGTTPCPSASCQPPLMIRDIEYPGVSSTRTCARGAPRGRLQRHHGDVRMIESRLRRAVDPEPSAAVRVRTGDHG